VHIRSVNWHHGTFGNTPPNRKDSAAALREGLRIAFDDKVKAADLHAQSVIVQVRDDHTVRDAGGNLITLSCWCEVGGTVGPGDFSTVGNALSAFTLAPVGFVGFVNGVNVDGANLREGDYRVLLKGDYVRDQKKQGVDANHVPPWVPFPPNPVQIPTYSSGDGAEGGLFESWFSLKP
jgi:hypothetical protein